MLRRPSCGTPWPVGSGSSRPRGCWSPPGGGSPDAAFQQLRRQARASSRKLADLAQEIVQDAQREHIAALAIDDARVREAEIRAGEAEQALQAAQTGLARRIAALDRARDDLDQRERAADERDRKAAARDRPPTDSEEP
jgi:hypothetical protein